MPLVLKLAPHEKIIVNGVVLENGEDPARLVVHNRGTILRGKDALRIEEADTPARRVLYAVQCLYLFPESREVYVDAARGFLADIAGAAPSLAPLAGEIARSLDDEDAYPAMKLAKRLVDRERSILGGWTGNGRPPDPPAAEAPPPGAGPDATGQ